MELFKKNFYVYLFLGQRESVNGEGERERETQNLKQAPGSEHRARCGARTHGL